MEVINGIREIDLKYYNNNKKIRIEFGPHYFIEISENNGNVEFVVGATHHGVKADASKAGGELDKMINTLSEEYKKNSF